MSALARLAALIAAVGLHALPLAAADDACLQPGRWTQLGGGTPQPIDADSVIAAQARKQVVLLGEQHDDADHHRWQLHVLAGLHARRESMVLGFEMFPRRVQPVLDRWVAGELSEARFLEEVQWDEVWNMPARFYLPLFHFARLNRVPMIALNVESSLIRSIASEGWDKVADAAREGVGRAAPPSPAYVDFLFQVHDGHVRMRERRAARSSRSDPRFRNFVDSQLTWDRAMAEALARGVQNGAGASGGAPLAVGIIGSGHVRHGHGVAHQLRDLGISEIGLLLPVDIGLPCRQLVSGLADAVFAIPRQAVDPPPPPRLGVSLEDADGGVRIVSVVAGSLAERSGLRAGDLIVDAGGTKMRRSALLAAAVRAQAPGSWLPLKLQRNGDAVELLIKFPPHP